MTAQCVDALVGLVPPSAAVADGLRVVAADLALATRIARLRAAVAASEYVCHLILFPETHLSSGCVRGDADFKGSFQRTLGVGFGMHLLQGLRLGFGSDL